MPDEAKPASTITLTLTESARDGVGLSMEFDPPVTPGGPDFCKETVHVADMLQERYEQWLVDEGKLIRA